MRSRFGTSLSTIQSFYRLPNWAHFLGFPILGIVFSASPSRLDFLLTFQVILASSLLLAFAYSFNVLFDTELENLTTKSHSTPIASRLRRLLFSLLPAVAGLALLTRSSESFLLGLIFVLVCALYSYPVPRLKAVPILCTIANGVGFSLLFLAGSSMVKSLSASSVLFFCLLVLLEIPAQLIHEVTHSRVDELFSVNTTAVRYGMKRSLDGAILNLAGAIVLVVAMSIQGIVGVLTALSAGSFAGVYALVFLRERKALNQATVSSEKPSTERFRWLRTEYKYGGILAGAAMALTLLL